MSDAAPPAAEQQTSATQGTAAAPVLGVVDDPARQGPRPRALVLLEPRRAFLSVRAKPMAALALGVMLAVSLAPPLAFVSQVDTAKLLERELKKSGKLEQVPQEQLEQLRSVGGTVMKVALPLGAVGKRALWIFVVTGLAFLLLRGARPELRFSTTLGAVALGCAPTALHDLATALTFLVKDPMTLADAQNAVLSNPAAWFALDTARSVAGALLHGLDFFTLWSCGLIAVGVNVVAGAKSVIPWAVTFGLHFTFVGLSAIGPAFQAG